MASIKEAGRLIEKVSLINLFMPRGLYVTMLLSGPHGIGKTQIGRQAANALNGYLAVVEGGNIKEGELSGLPFASKLPDGSMEVSFIKYNIVAQMARLEELYFKQATGKGFLGGTVFMKEVVDSEGNPTGRYETHYTDYDNDGNALERVIPAPSAADMEMNGYDNRFKFGEELPAEVKMRLYESAEIKPYLLLIDEMNRTDEQTFKEFMNFVLNKTINGYNLPWWVNIIAAQNPSSQGSSYATIQMDGAQQDRYLKVAVSPNSDDWANHMMSLGRDIDYVEAILDTNQLTSIDSSQRDTDKMLPSPRSWDMVMGIMTADKRLRKSKHYEKMNLDPGTHEDDLHILIAGKVGSQQATAFFSSLKNNEGSVKPSEIITGKSLAGKDGVLSKENEGHIPASIKAELAKQKSVRRRFTAISVISYLQQNWDMWERRSKDARYKDEIAIIGQQLGYFTEDLSEKDKSASAVFRTLLVDVQNTVIEGTKTPLFTKVHTFLAKSMLAELVDERKQLENLNKSDF